MPLVQVQVPSAEWLSVQCREKKKHFAYKLQIDI